MEGGKEGSIYKIDKPAEKESFLLLHFRDLVNIKSVRLLVILRREKIFVNEIGWVGGGRLSSVSGLSCISTNISN